MQEARMKNPVLVLPDALNALLALNTATEQTDVSPTTLKLVHLRTSQINGCSVCVDASCREMKKAGEKDERIFGVAAWHDMPYFTEAERAALALTEAITRQSDGAIGVTDEIWAEAAKHYDEPALAAIIIATALENVWNRLNTTVRQMAGTAWE